MFHKTQKQKFKCGRRTFFLSIQTVDCFWNLAKSSAQFVSNFVVVKFGVRTRYLPTIVDKYKYKYVYKIVYGIVVLILLFITYLVRYCYIFLCFSRRWIILITFSDDTFISPLDSASIVTRMSCNKNILRIDANKWLWYLIHNYIFQAILFFTLSKKL